MAIVKHRSAKIKLYSDQFEIHEVDGKPVPKGQGIWTGTIQEVLTGLGVWIETYMVIRKKVPLIIEISEEGRVFLSPGSKSKN